MFTQLCLALALLVALPAWPQMDTNATEGGTADQAGMQTPPPVSGEAYSTAFGSETRSNYLRTGLIFSTAYSDNVIGFSVGKPVSDISYSIWPMIAIDRTVSRLHWMLNYSPGFTIYQRTSNLDQADENVALGFNYRLSPHITISLADSLLKTSNAFNQPDALSGVAISGSTQPPVIAVIAPLGDLLSNMANTELTYQFSGDGMIGVEGRFTNLDYHDSTEVSGLYDSSSSGGAVFYSYRLSRKQYLGAIYQYSRILAYPVNAESEVQAHTVFLFYTIYLKPTFSISISGGPQHFDVSESPLPAYGSWSPTLAGSMSWQALHTNFAASYSRVVIGGGGLVGAFQENIANASARWQLARTWSVGAAADYSMNKNVTPSSFLSTAGGHSIFGTVSVQHQLSDRMQLEFGYTRLHESYSGIPVISISPDTDRGFISITYSFSRPLGG